MPRTRKPAESLTDKVKRYFRVKDSIKRGYARADKLEDEIFKEMSTGESVPLSEFEKAVMVDNFAEGNKAFRAHGISRFELKKVKA
jgi:hypothetical protein